MFIPYRTDAPLYHSPWCTIGLIVVTVLVYFTVLDTETLLPLTLSHGDGLHPAQWVTSNFVHGSIGHLLGNLLFLWTFGLVIEGKIGWWRFFLVFMGIGVVQCAFEQTVFLGNEGGLSYGNSAILFGLMAMAMVWAPENEVDVLLWFLRPRHYTLRIKTLGLFYLAWEAAFVALEGTLGGFSGSLLHLMGAAVGLPLGIVMVKKGWVDCGGWDWFAVRAGVPRQKALSALRGRREAPVEAPVDDEDLDLSLELLQDSLAASDFVTAFEIYRSHPKWKLPEASHRGLVVGLARGRHWAACAAAGAGYFRTQSTVAPAVRLATAEALVELRRPSKALAVLSTKNGQPAELGSEANVLRERAERLIAEGTLELDVD